MKSSLLILCVAAPLLISCSPPNSDQTPKIVESQRQALDKAKSVEATLGQAAHQKKQKIDAQTE
ncbi:MAG: hypothetical protein ABI475_05970 [Methylophilaceae bacterium]